MTPRRFYVPPEEWQTGTLLLPRAEARHAAQVLRLRPGDAVHLFDGKGRSATAVIDSVHGSQVSVREVGGQTDKPMRVPRPDPEIILVPSLIKAKAWDWLLQKATELGATAIQPLVTDHSVVKPDPEDAEPKRERWHRTLVEAAKQCGTPWLPDLYAPMPLKDWLKSPHQDEEIRLWASLHSGAKSLIALAAAWRLSGSGQSRRYWIAIGPEGDFSETERKTLEMSDAQPVRLGPFVLRAETASLAALAVLRSVLDQNPDSDVACIGAD